MTSNFVNCGSHAGYERHRRAGEKACKVCRESERERVRLYRERHKAENARLISDSVNEDSVVVHDGSATVQQVIPGGHLVAVTVPTSTDPLESAQWRLWKVRAALEVAHPRDVSALARMECETVTLIGELLAQSKRLSVLDKVTARRAGRLKGSLGS